MSTLSKEGNRQEGFPLGTAAIHPDWPEARFNVSGMFVYTALVLDVVRLARVGFECRLPIDAIHGAPAIPWNGGRPFVPWNGGRNEPLPFDPGEVEKEFARLHACGIGCFLTFTNHLIDEHDLNDPHGNFLLERLADRPDLNGIIVSSERLSKYIATRYPALRQVASITKVAIEGGQGKLAFYQDLGNRFHQYVVHPDDCYNLGLLSRLDPRKAEIIVNENCLRGCTIRAHHYELIARAQKAYQQRPSSVESLSCSGVSEAPANTAAIDLERAMVECPSVPMTRQVGARQRNCNLTRAEMKAIYEMGFRCFKLQGRRDNVYTYGYDLTRYMLEPDIAAPLAYSTLCLDIPLLYPTLNKPVF